MGFVVLQVPARDIAAARSAAEQEVVMQAPMVATFEQMHVSSSVGHEDEAQVMAH